MRGSADLPSLSPVGRSDDNDGWPVERPDDFAILPTVQKADVDFKRASLDT